MSELNEFNQPVDIEVCNWSGANFPQKNILSGNFARLEPLDIHKHAQALYQVLCVETPDESWTYLPYGPFASFSEYAEWLINKIAESDTLLYCIMEIKTQSPLGICGYLRINPPHGVIEVGHLHFSTALKRTPIATDAMYLMMEYAFEKLGYRRYEWKCHSLNAASRNAATRLGFTFEGIFRQCNVFKNRNRDTAWFSILDSEWPQLQTNFKRWLSEDNFDQEGKQKSSLAISVHV